MASTKHLLLAFAALLLSCSILHAQDNAASSGSNAVQDNYSIYVSKQRNETSESSGKQSKTTDKYEKGTVTLSKSGPIVYEVTPNDLGIGTNETKTWEGKVRGNVQEAPEPGTTAPASITAHYDVTYSRPAGVGSGGTVKETYNCNEGVDDGCAFHGPSGGMHEIVRVVGDYTVNFTVYSILVSLPDTICMEAIEGETGVKGTAEPTTFPGSGGTFQWTALSDNLTISDPSARTPELRLPDKKALGSVKVEFTFEGVTYEATAAVKFCDCKCEPLIDQSLAFGPYSISYSADPAKKTPDSDGNCKYSSKNAGFTMNMNGQITKSPQLQDAELSFKKHCKEGTITEARVHWKGDKDIGEIKYFSAKVKEADLALDNNAQLTGSVRLNAYLNEDQKLYGKTIILKKGVNGTFDFKFTAGMDNASGTFDFQGVKDFNLDIKKDKKIIAKFQNGSLTSDGTLQATFKSNGKPEYETNAFKVTLNDLALKFSINLQDGFKIIDGKGSATLSEMKGTEGTLSLGLSYNQDNCHAKISGEDLKALTMELNKVDVQADFTMEFDLTKVEGSLKAKHPKFDTEIDITSFVVENGSLKTFSGSGKVVFSKYKFELVKASYDGNKLSISAKAKIDGLKKGSPAAALDVSEFTIAMDGTIGIGGISGELSCNPMKGKFDAKFGTNEFKGSFDATLTKKIGISGDILVGATPVYNYGDFTLAVKADVVIPNTGLKMTKIGGTAGFNYPSQGDYKVGLILAVADVANLCEVEGKPTIILGNSSINMTLDGTVKVPRTKPFLKGDLHASFMLPDVTLNGHVGTSIKIPASGYIFTSKNLKVHFAVGNGTYNVNGSNMGGNMFNNLVTFSNGSINMGGKLSPFDFNGNLAGKASGSFQTSFNKSTFIGTFSGDLDLNMNSNVNASLDANGLAGSFNVNVSGSSTASYSNSWTTQSFTISGNGLCEVGAKPSGYYLYGNMNLNLPFKICVPNSLTSLYCIETISVPVNISL